MPAEKKPHKSSVCPWWLAPSFDNPLRHWIHPPEAILDGLVQPGQVVVDLGCGMGYFTIPMAKLVGPEGKIIAVDVQPQMLERVRRRAIKAGVPDRIQMHLSQARQIGLDERVDFALAFWMVHEVPDQFGFLAQVYTILKAGGRFLLVEPVGHVTERGFQKTVEAAQAAGFQPVQVRKVSISRAMVFLRRADREVI